MSQSDEHRSLVIQAARILGELRPNLSLLVDLQATPGNRLPPTISGHRPDVYASEPSEDLAVIGEAKTYSDLDRPHTLRQVLSYATYLGKRSKGILLLAVPPSAADRSKTLLWFTRRQVQPCTTNFITFDGLDLWQLGSGEEFRWRLS